MTHLENLIIEYYTWLGCVVRHNQKVGRRARGGWEMELDVVVYDMSQKRVIHLEPSLDADNWAKRESRFTKKFEAGRKYIPVEVFPWIPSDTQIEQIAILIGAGKARRTLAGAEVFLVVLIFYPLCAWYLRKKAMARIHGSGVLVSEAQFPQIHACVATFKRRLGVTKSVDVYIVQANIINAFAVR